MNERIAVIGLGYVGLPLAVALARKFPGTIGFDTSRRRLDELGGARDKNGELGSSVIRESGLKLAGNPADLADRTFFIIAVPTPVTRNNQPDFDCLLRASATVGAVLKAGAVVVYESTVYPGATEEICGPALERASGLKAGSDFKLGYSPERINPGDKVHTLEKVTKIVSAQDAVSLERVVRVYGAVVETLHRAASIKVAEAAKVIENTQRDLNIALMNELAMIFERIGIRTADVLAAARSKWNFVPFTPGLVGGHCIGVDPYYLTAKAEELGYQPQVILAGRRINNGMGPYLAQRLVKMLVQSDRPVKGAKVGILGLTFKEDVPDLRNSRVPDIVAELRQFGVEPLVHDPLGDPAEALRVCGVALAPLEQLQELDGLILAVSHRAYLEMPRAQLLGRVRSGGAFIDVKSVLDPAMERGIHYWSL
jgi:UDP-N-acetyl-D-glucosamine/UDP-N-acetyl-D-galactosamine dehydrogenase